jgi:nonsense-mediated mRNA decay protein 3
MDIQNSTTNSKLTFSVEIIPICKDDIVCLPIKVARSMSNISQIVVCHRVGNQVYLIDPTTLTLGDISANHYWRNAFPPLADIAQATEFIVLDIEPTSFPPKTAKGGRFLLADAQVSPVGGSMNADVIYHTRTHLGAVLKAGDTVMGYMLASANYNNEHWDLMNHTLTPEVILVRKTYPNRRKKSKPRGWRLKSIVGTLSSFLLCID